jgi:hypothetical protein
MHQTVASERNHVRLRAAPTSEFLRPLPRATQIKHRLTQVDHLAVGDPRKHRRHLVCGDRDHDLVQQRHTLGDSTLQDQRIPAAEPREHRRVGVGEALGDLPRLDEARIQLRISLEQARQRGEHPQPCLLDAVATALLQEPSAADNPAHRGSQVASEEEAEGLPERTVCRPLGVASTQPLVVGGDPGLLASVVGPDHVGGNRKALEILGPQPAFPMSRRQLGERVTPHPPLKRTAGSRVSIGDGHRLHEMPRGGRRHGLRWSVVMSVSSGADPGGGEGSAWVAAVAAQGGGEVDRPRLAEHADGQGAQGRLDMGGRAGADLGGVFGEGDIAQVLQRLDGPVPAQQVGQAGGAGLVERVRSATARGARAGARSGPARWAGWP